MGWTWKTQQLRIGASLRWSSATDVAKSEPPQPIERRYEIDTLHIETPAISELGYRVGIEREQTTAILTSRGEVLQRTIRRTDTIRVAKAAVLDAAIRAVALDNTQRESETFTLMVEEFNSVLMSPLLNYVFFEENSDAIPPRYTLLSAAETSGFRAETVNNPDRLQTYYHILNIIGKRMSQVPAAILTLTGCNAGTGVEKDNTDLSRRRAEAIRRYLTGVWRIPSGRIRIESRNLPEKAANSIGSDGEQENRRVEITSTNPSITAPIISNDTLRIASIPTIRFRTSATHTKPISTWNITVRYDGAIVREFSGTGEPPPYVDWNVGTSLRMKSAHSSMLEYTLTMSDESAATTSARGRIVVEMRTISRKKIERLADKEINRFGLILFDVRSTDMTPANRSIIANIKPYLKPTSSVRITGYTDRLGEPQLNQTIADGRARTTAKELGVDERSSTVQGFGNAGTYNPDVPEGRMYTRTVDIVIETPVAE